MKPRTLLQIQQNGETPLESEKQKRTNLMISEPMKFDYACVLHKNFDIRLLVFNYCHQHYQNVKNLIISQHCHVLKATSRTTLWSLFKSMMTSSHVTNNSNLSSELNQHLQLLLLKGEK